MIRVYKYLTGNNIDERRELFRVLVEDKMRSNLLQLKKEKLKECRPNICQLQHPIAVCMGVHFNQGGATLFHVCGYFKQNRQASCLEGCSHSDGHQPSAWAFFFWHYMGTQQQRLIQKDINIQQGFNIGNTYFDRPSIFLSFFWKQVVNTNHSHYKLH